MNRRLAVCLLTVGVLGFSGCAARTYKVTPVTAVPTSPSDEEALKKALLGEGWRFHSTIYEDGKVEEGSSMLFIHMEFAPDGAFTYRVQGRPQVNTYTVEGKNIVTTHPGVKTLRVESINDHELKVFVYEMSLTWVFQR